MPHSGSGVVRVILFALFANLGIALSKFVGSFLTGSASMLAEAIHSLVDCMNQGLLLLGKKKSAKLPDERHPLGYGRETFFWSFIVAIFLFSMGGLFAIYEGVHKMKEPEAISSPAIALGILLFGIILESFSFHACYVEIKKQNTSGSLWRWLRSSTSADLIVIFLEDLAALLGLILASVAVGIGWYTANPIWDAIGSITIGILLVVVAVVLAIEIKSLLIGESPSQNYRIELSKTLAEIFPGGKLLHLIALQTGADETLLSFKFDPGPSVPQTAELINRINVLEHRIKTHFTEVRWLFVEPDHVA